DTGFFYTPSGVRLRQHIKRNAGPNWLLLPGGPGIGSESLAELADAMVAGALPGSIWFVDLPGDGSNRMPQGSDVDPFAGWPQVVVEAAQALPDVILIGHSTGGMYLLATPELEPHIVGLALFDTAPDASWHPRFVAMTQRDPLPAVEAATAIYEHNPQDDAIAAIAVASAPWNFTPEGVAAGRALLARMPYNSAAVIWSDRHFDHIYAASWWPSEVPVLVLAGEHDRIVWQGGWEDPQFHTPNAFFRQVPRAGHFPWIENPLAVVRALAELDSKR
ncbi:MAG: alpha/beta fold hydrolase, partial [Sphingomonas sp.]